MKTHNSIAIVIVGMVFPAALAAQVVRGVATDRVTNAPLPGVVVILLDSTGNTVGRTLGNGSGEYQMSAPRSGRYRLRTLRIGFRPATSEPVQLVEGSTAIQPLRLEGVPFLLDTVRVRDRSACASMRDSAATTYAIWEQVRTALTAADLTARTRAIEATIVTYERSLDPGRDRVLQQSSRGPFCDGAKCPTARP